MSKKRVWKVLALILVGVLIAFPVIDSHRNPMMVYADNEDVDEDDAKETGYRILTITTAEEFAELAKNCVYDTWSKGLRVELDADISLQEYPNLIISTFGGTFDGNGHIINDVKITDNLSPAGLFGTLQMGGRVKNLEVRGTVKPEESGEFIGGIVGENYGKISGCNFNGTVASGEKVGGIVGINALSGRIVKCTSTGLVSGTKMVGGIAGSSLGRIADCENRSYVNTSSIDPKVRMEDIHLDFSRDQNSLKNSDLGLTTNDTGGIVGYSTGIINSCSNSGQIGYLHVGYNVGGIAGRSNGYIYQCTNTGTVLGRKDVGGIAGQMEPYIVQTISESTLGTIQGQLKELDDLITAANEHNTEGVGALTDRLNSISNYADSAVGAANNIKVSGQKRLDELTSDDLSVELPSDLEDKIKNKADEYKKDDSTVTPATEADPGNSVDVEQANSTRDEDADSEPSEEPDEESGERTEEPYGEKTGIEVSPAMTENIESPADTESNADDSDNESGADSDSNNDSGGDSGGSSDSDSDGDSGGSSDSDSGGDSGGSSDGGSGGNSDNNSQSETSGSTENTDSDRKNNIENIELPTREDLKAGTQIDISSNVGDLTSALYGMTGQMRMLNSDITNVTGQLADDLTAIQGKINEISDTAFDAIENGSGQSMVVDNSREDASKATLGKVDSSTNHGPVHADINVGGIAGSIAMEHQLDPEDDLGLNLNGTQRRQLECKAIVQSCDNHGQITSKRNYAGGICGRMDLGLIWYSENYGTISSESGSYVGGIAGLTASAVEHCLAKGILAGSEHVGGIVGTGTEADLNGGSSSVSSCFSMAAIQDYKRYAGAISGSDRGNFHENYFISDDLAGINGRSLGGSAEPIAYEDIGKNKSIKVPDTFTTLQLVFRTEDQVIQTMEVPYGTSLKEEDIPQAPTKEGYYSVYDRSDFADIHSDMDVTAVYYPYITALASEGTRVDQRPIFLVEGSFDENDRLNAEPLAENDKDSFLNKNFLQSVLTLLQGASIDDQLTEQWTLSIPDDGETTHRVRYLSTYGSADKVSVYIKDGKNWHKASTSVIGSYLTFQASGSKVRLAVVSTFNVWGIRMILTILLLALALGLCRFWKSRHPGTKVAVREEENELVAETKDSSTSSDAQEHAKEPETEVKAESVETAAAFAGETEDGEHMQNSETLNKKKRSKKRVIFAGLAAVLVLAVVLGGMYGPKLVRDLQAYQYLKNVMDQEEQNAQLTVDAQVGGTDLDFTVDMRQTKVDNRRVTGIRKDSAVFYYCDDVVLLENGSAYQVNGVLPDFSVLLSKPLELYRMADIQKENNVYRVTVEEEAAKEILDLLMPTAAEYIERIDPMNIQMVIENQTAARLIFDGSGVLSTNQEEEFNVSAVLNLNPVDMEAIPMEDAVTETIRSGGLAEAKPIGEDALRLVKAWNNWNSYDAIAADLQLSADCSIISFNDTMNLYQWNKENTKVRAIRKDGSSIYFTDTDVCTESGNKLTRGEHSIVEAGDLLSLAYTLCLNADISSSKKGSTYTYTLALDSEDMRVLAEEIAPEIRTLDQLEFTDGTVVLTLEEEEITQLTVNCNGRITLTLISADVHVGASLTPQYQSEVPELPEAVRKALLR